MKIERVIVKGFKCFGPDGTIIDFEDSITVFVGGNGTGKTALFLALSRLFGVTSAQRTIRKNDFYISPECDELLSDAELCIDVVFSFPELESEDADVIGDAVPEFFNQMSVSQPGSPLKVRIIFKATWIDDGTPSGSIEEDIRWISTLDDSFEWEECQKVLAIQRGTIQFVYVPATRKVEDQVTTLLKGRLWQAVKWSDEFRELTTDAISDIQEMFQKETPTTVILDKLEKRWSELHAADTDTTPIIRLIERRFDEFVRKADFAFYPDEFKQERAISDLSDGQRSLFYIALTAATLEVERDAYSHPQCMNSFDQEKLHRAHLTLLAIEEPENSLSPFFLSRIITQARDIGGNNTAQVMLSSHSAAILSRIAPEEVRYFRIDHKSRQTSIRTIKLPEKSSEEGKFVRLAVKAYPELYFARFVIFVEGDSEQLVIPRIAEAMGVSLDPSFVPIVPLGGRFCMHFWRLLSELAIPYATLLDFDIGRAHGGANMIRTIFENLQAIGVNLENNEIVIDGQIKLDALEKLEDNDLWLNYEDNKWIQAIEYEGVFISDPLDLDFAMLVAFPDAYQHPKKGGSGPRNGDCAIKRAKTSTLKTNGDATLYDDDYDDEFRWYPYLFLQRSKPETHLAALTRITNEQLNKDAPASLKSLIEYVKDVIGLGDNVE